MYCRYCGTAIPESGLFCPQCGAKTDAPTQPISAQETPVSEVSAAATMPSVPEAAPVPNETPICEQAPVAEPLFCAEETPAPVKPKRSHKRLIISLIAAVLALTLLSGSLVYALVLNTPEYKLANALENTGEDFLDLFDNCDNLKAVSKTIGKIGESQKSFVGAELSGKVGNESFSCTVELEQDITAKRQSGKIALSIPNAMPDLSLRFYGDEDMLAFSSPELLKNTYSVPTKDFGQKLLDSPLGEMLELDGKTKEEIADISLNLFSEFQWDKFLQEHSEEYKALKESFQITEVNEQIAEMPNLTIYSIALDWNIAGKLFRAYREQLFVATYGTAFLADKQYAEFDELFEQLADAELEIRIGVNEDNRAVAFYVFDEKGRDSLTILLKGEDNPWDEFVLLSDSESIATIVCEPTQNGPRFTFESGTTAVTLECNDSDALFTLSSKGTPTFSIRYAHPKDGGAEFIAEIPVDGVTLDFTMIISPSKGIEPLSETPIDLFSLSRSELEKLAYEVLGNLQNLMR